MKTYSKLRQKSMILISCLLFALHLSARDGAECNYRITVTPGTIYCQSDYGQSTYYEFTAEKDGILLLSDGDAENSVYLRTSCYSSSSETYSSEGELAYKMVKGQSYIIEWYNNETGSFDWTLEFADPVQGDFCTNPITATAENKCTSKVNDYVYYKYTAASTGMATLFDSTEANYVIIKKDCDADFFINGTSKVKFDITKGETYLIMWECLPDYPFTWTIKESTPENGETCASATPLTITSDTTDIKTTRPYQFYSVSFPTNQIVSTFSTNSETVSVRNACQKNYFSRSSSGDLQFEAIANTQYTLGWENSDSVSEWSLRHRDVIAGETCGTPIAINQAGTVSFLNSDTRSTQYYSFTTTTDGMLTISENTKSKNVYIYSDCDTKITYDYYGEVSLLVKAGEKYIIKWESSNNFQWKLSNTPLVAGEVCSVAISAQKGKNEFDYTNKKKSELYYTYTATLDGYISLTDSSNFYQVTVYDSCKASSYIDKKQGSVTVPIKKGHTYIIKWTDNDEADFSWNLEERLPIPGEDCANPIIISQTGNIKFDNASKRPTQYYSFTATTDGILQISDNTGKNYITMYHNCDGDYEQYDYEGEIKIEANKDSTYLIQWKSSNNNNFVWKIENRQSFVGELCSNPIVLSNVKTQDTVKFDYNSNKLKDQYYTFTAPIDGFLTIKDTKKVYNSVQIYSDCNSSYLYSYYDSITMPISKGVTYIIDWRSNPDSNFTWTYSYREPRKGETCYNPIIVNSNKIDFKDSKKLPIQYYQFTTKTDGLVILQSNAQYAYVSVYDKNDCSSIFKEKREEITFQSKKDSVILIAWENDKDFTWTIENRDTLPGEYPITGIAFEAVNGKNLFNFSTVLPAQFYKYTAKQDGVIAITDGADHYAYVAVFSSNLDDIDSSETGELITKVKQGESYYIGWATYDSTSFSWTLENRNSTEGDFCEKPEIDPSTKDNQCFGEKNGSISLEVTKGLPPYRYRWSTTSTQSGLIDIPAGLYAVTVTDTIGCSAVKLIEVSEPNALNIETTLISPNCKEKNGEISLSVTGGKGSYSYKWSPDSISSDEAQLTKLASGVYSVTVSDYNKCTQSLTINLKDNNAPVIMEDSVSNSRCNKNTGKIYLSTLGGQEPYSYKWSDASSAEDRTDLAAGQYNLTVTDGLGCNATYFKTIKQITFAQPSISLVTVNSKGKNLVVWMREETSAINYYTIYRETEKARVYDSVGSVKYNETASVFVDTTAKATIQSWRYKISATDFCGYESPLSPEYKTMYLQQNIGLKNVINLLWDSYEGSQYKTFNIYRQFKDRDPELLKRVPTSVNRYTDETPPTDIDGYFVAIDLPTEIRPKEFTKLKSDSGPFSQSMSNMSEASIVGLKDAEISDINSEIYPNPATTDLKIIITDNTIASSIITDALGNVVLQYQTQQTIDISKLPNGIYNILIETSKHQQISHRFVKQ